MFLGLRTVLYHTPDLAKAKAWYSKVLGIEPYFDQPFYVGYEVGGYELGLVPDSEDGATGPGGSTAYWGVPNADEAYAKLLAQGARSHTLVQNVGEGIKTGAVRDPFGNVLGIIENPHFKPPS